MALNYIWIGFFALTFVFALFESIVNGDIDIWSRVMSSSFDSAKTAFGIAGFDGRTVVMDGHNEDRGEGGLFLSSDVW